VLTELFQKLKKTGFRVLIGVSGHNVQGQIDMINKALEPVVAMARWPEPGCGRSLSARGPSRTPTTLRSGNLQHDVLLPELVEMRALGDGPLAPDMKAPDGIGGLDPRKHASPAIGRRNVELASRAIGKKARELLEKLPPEPPNRQPLSPAVVDDLTSGCSLRSIRPRKAGCADGLAVFEDEKASALGNVRRNFRPFSRPRTRMAVASPSASRPTGAVTVTLANSFGDLPLAGSNMWCRE